MLDTDLDLTNSCLSKSLNIVLAMCGVNSLPITTGNFPLSWLPILEGDFFDSWRVLPYSLPVGQMQLKHTAKCYRDFFAEFFH